MHAHQEANRVELILRKATCAPESAITSDRVRSLATRLIEGAPALTPGEMRELANAILDHGARSVEQA